MSKIKRLFIAASVLPLGVLAEDPQQSQLSQWVTTAKTEMAGWTSDLTPLYTAGITIVLLVVAWRLFKRTTKSAT